ncbi:type II toxin-antitoxin system Phd/YefM family antitoxin [Crocosphaera sp. XPORK-15E]|uniref:type II toxin-antitoxin system Phd/YefM family antitoxin n=1 Tax=Crocosphaera sp. XPORK-15E TaxID=3110247 RepID=UPI002B1FA84C|nr:type II toxin-antitoxin system Phd/YefM family antitoxin [Crocosphaera sp. XPORK-15E]MEA5535231.1 type II toxin-antitoxin system Phd/YefM family antitoxin [Crocosphaera sp. XPORK-15E]
MDSLSLQEVTENLDNLINQITENHQPIIIKGTENDVVIVSKEDWSAIEETIYLNSIPGYIDSINQVIASPREEWVKAEDLGL